jgi:hypothetical protein
MMTRLSLAYAHICPVILRAREIIATMLSAPNDHEVDLTIENTAGGSVISSFGDIRVMHVQVDKEHRSLTPVVFRDTAFVQLEPIVVLEHLQSSDCPSISSQVICGTELDSPMAQLSVAPEAPGGGSH